MVMALGAVIALLVARFFGKDAETDAFFAAYGIYGVGMTFAQTFRLTTVSSFVSSGSAETITRMLGAVALMCLALAVPMVALAVPLGHVLVENDPTDVAPLTLRMLWLALTGQLIAAILATVLAVRGRFTAMGIGTLVGGFVSVAVFVATQGLVGVPAAALGLVVSAVWLTVAFGAVLLRAGERLTRPTRPMLRAMAVEAGRLSLAAATFFGTTLAYVICIAVANRLGEGEGTIFAYSYMLATVLIGLTANVTAMVRSPALVASAERAREIAAASLWSFRFTLLLVGPVLGLTVLIGPPVMGVVLGGEFSDADVDRLVATLLGLSPWVLATAAGIFAVVELLARGDLRRLALLTLAQVSVLAVATITVGAVGGGLAGVAGALSAVMVGVALVQLHWAFPGEWGATVAAMAKALAREACVLAVAFGPAAVLLLVLDDSAAVTVAAALLATVLVAVASYMAWPREVGALLGVVRRSPPAPPLNAGASSPT
jgi:hypothetical protein